MSSVAGMLLASSLLKLIYVRFISLSRTLIEAGIGPGPLGHAPWSAAVEFHHVGWHSFELGGFGLAVVTVVVGH